MIARDKDKYLARERARARQHYVPVSLLTLEERQERAERGRENLRRYRQRKKAQVKREISD